MTQIDLHHPFPLQRKYLFRIVPGLLLLMLVLVVGTVFAVRQVQQDVYLQLATQRAEGIAKGVRGAEPLLWERLIRQEPLDDPESLRIIRAFENEEHEFAVSQLKAYDASANTIYATDRKLIGQREASSADSSALPRVLQTGETEMETKTVPGEGEFYELYIPLLDAEGRIEMVFELYEPAAYLNSVLFRTSLPVILIPALLLLLLMISLSLLVARAQHDINRRTQTINDLRKRLESLVSRRAVEAMRLAGELNQIPSEKEECTLFFSDIRGFTSFSETHSPDQIIRFLNWIVALQVKIIHRYGGDVDKMIGDAVFARFHGSGREDGAIRAAIAIQQALLRKPPPRGLGIGIYSGIVVAGGIGPEERQDYTVIGDSVNIASRLCSAAAVGEIICDSATADQAKVGKSRPTEALRVKGKDVAIAVKRLRVKRPDAG